ncbi:spore coat U domain-containing protein [Variovorax dokdonensis]|uniref:Spore coat U domain-containing protein n=1 Tax=Variovorax dokdonensis TaxID=344883 RepID=A0ABT7NAX3_9BURK|nr:spore coat U domain-containing protein [Variovorax dokdonensis]MDM0045083.1 spore coat U domain-containing protein [Variovorax dokdonensis]
MNARSSRWWRHCLALAMLAALFVLPAREAAAAPYCTATMSTLSFGSVDLVNGGTLSATATLNYTCTNDQNGSRSAFVCFNIGDGSASIASGGGHWTPRILRNAAGNEMNVQLYQGSTQTIWGSRTQVIPDPYDARVINIARNSSLSGSYTMRGEIQAGQAGLTPGTYTSDFNANHTALRYTFATNANQLPSDCNSATTDGGIFPFSVNATVVKSCLVSADPMNFGSVDGIASSANIDAVTTIRVLCSRPTAYNVTLIPSSNATDGSSAMKGTTSGNADTVPYRLYSNAARTAQWGSLSSNDVEGTGNGATQSLTVYGRVPGLPNVRPDNYKDTVTVNVVY